METQELIKNTKEFVQKSLKGAEGGHDWFHVERVYQNAKLIAQGENADLRIVELGALLHDIADAKFYDGDESVGPLKATEFLLGEGVDKDTIEAIVFIINNISFKNSLQKDSSDNNHTIELKVIQDADRLDAIGAIGIARAFNYGGFKNRALYDPDILPLKDQDKETYKKSKAPTINHFYEKLLLLKGKMNTDTGRKLAEKRHEFMESYLEQFYNEWNGKL